VTNKSVWISVLGLAAMSPAMSFAAVSYSTSGSSYQQTFDSLPTSGAANTWANDSTLAGWSLFTATNGTVPTIAAGGWIVEHGCLLQLRYRHGERSRVRRHCVGWSVFRQPGQRCGCGYLAGQSPTPRAARSIPSRPSYDGEQWRNAATPARRRWSLSMDSARRSMLSRPGTMQDRPSISFRQSSVQPPAALDGNATADRSANLGGTITSAGWANNSTLWLRWIDNNDAGNDHGLSLDNFNFSAAGSAVSPEPASMSLLILGAAVPMLRRRRHA